MPDTCVGCGRDGGKDRDHPDGLFCDLCWHGEEGLEIIRLRAENEALMRWVHTDHRLSSFEDCQACAALRAHLNEGEAT